MAIDMTAWNTNGLETRVYHCLTQAEMRGETSPHFRAHLRPEERTVGPEQDVVTAMVGKPALRAPSTIRSKRAAMWEHGFESRWGHHLNPSSYLGLVFVPSPHSTNTRRRYRTAGRVP